MNREERRKHTKVKGDLNRKKVHEMRSHMGMKTVKEVPKE